MKVNKKWTQAQDDADDRKNGIKEGSKRDLAIDRSRGLAAKKKQKTQKQVIVTKKASKKKAIKMTGKFDGKSNALGQGGRAAQLRAQGVPGGVIGNLARAAQAAPGQANYHKAANKKKAESKKAYMNRVMPGGKNC